MPVAVSTSLNADTVRVQNPIIHADYSDPDVVCVGEDFYLTASSFNFVPGLPILHSKDLVNWTIIAHAVPYFDEPGYDRFQGGAGVWAPSIRYHDGQFYIYWGDPDRGIYMVQASDPKGPWTKPHLVQEGRGLIDPCPLWDDDGRAWLVHAWANSRSGKHSMLTLRAMSTDGRRFLDEGKIIIDGNGNPELKTLEGPKFYKHDGEYLILAPAGGVHDGWQMAFRAKAIDGPYEMKRVLEQGIAEINGPHQGGWVRRADGTDWFIHFQDKDAYGRVTHLNRVTWKDGWPEMGIDFDGNGIGEPEATMDYPTGGIWHPELQMQTSDEFDAKEFGLQWQWNANPQPGWASLSERPGWLRLYAQRVPDDVLNINAIANILSQKWSSQSFDATCLLDLSGLKPGDRIGLIAAGASAAWLQVKRTDDGLQLSRYNHTQKGKDMVADGSIKVASVALDASVVYLKLSIDSSADCTTAFSLDGDAFQTLGEAHPIREGHWVGSTLGLFCTGNGGGFVDIDWVRLTPNDGK